MHARDGVLKFARQPKPVLEPKEESRPNKRRKLDHPSPVTNGEVASRRSTRSQSKRTAVSASQASQEPIPSQEEVADSEDEGSVYDNNESLPSRKQALPEYRDNKELNDGLVECPCCTRRMKETAINAHLDRCVNGLPTSPEPAAVPISNGSLAFVQRTKSPIVAATKDRLPSINYALYSDASLRKKLKELGIPNHGSKELMRKRHTEWMNLWNANCDALRPRTKRELLRDLDIWERTLGKQLEKTVAAGGVSGVMVKDFDRDGWAKTQKSEFDDLIQKAREKRSAAAAAKQESESASGTKEIDKDVSMTGLVADQDQEAGKQSNGDSNLEADMRSSNPTPQHHGMSVDGSHDENREQVCPDGQGKLPEDEAPQTPQKGDAPLPDQHAAIDLTSSPVVSLGLETDGGDNMDTPKKRSRFFV